MRERKTCRATRVDGMRKTRETHEVRTEFFPAMSSSFFGYNDFLSNCITLTYALTSDILTRRIRIGDHLESHNQVGAGVDGFCVGKRVEEICDGTGGLGVGEVVQSNGEGAFVVVDDEVGVVFKEVLQECSCVVAARDVVA